MFGVEVPAQGRSGGSDVIVVEGGLCAAEIVFQGTHRCGSKRGLRVKGMASNGFLWRTRGGTMESIMGYVNPTSQPNENAMVMEKFTWWNKREHPYTVRERLDRACGNTAWKYDFSNARVVRSAWDILVSTDPNIAVWENVKGCREALKQWDKNVFGNVRRRIKEVEEENEEFKVQEILMNYFQGIFSSRGPSDDALEAALSGSDVTRSVLSMLNDVHLLHKMNFTHIVLIPKRTNPETVSHFRPISLCNTMVKIASKCVANRLKLILDHVISPSQSAFIPNRLITNNVLIAFELNHFVKNRTRGRTGQFGYFKPDRGLRQGDPLSPYLFLFVAEVFSSMLQTTIDRREMEGIAVSRGAPRISHLLFADDTIIFGKATEEAMLTLVRVLDIYAAASGQEINLEKSSIVISRNIRAENQRRLATILGVQITVKHEKYLGLPAVAGRSRSELFQSVKDRIWARIDGWNSKLLSQAGRAVLVKSVLQSIPTYLMSCFRMPDYVLEEVERISAKFLWFNRGEKLAAMAQIMSIRKGWRVGFP
ncbi:UNVERIFIED_CONTAM: putative mitochondrial protein [Sesamum latifolium]|uniref:Mitochondrial protein n=1 Tax=Sesamum latifolium TaxID=2727402 RepID=A0AAW2TNP9_9LAMI